MEPKKGEESNNVTTDLRRFISFFPKLLEIQAVNYEQMNLAITHLKLCSNSEQFYYDRYNCVKYTLEFIFTNVSFLTEDSAIKESLLMSLISLFKNIIRKINVVSSLKHLNISGDRVMHLLNHLIDNHKVNYVRLEAGKMYMELLETDVLKSCSNDDLCLMAFKTCSIFIEEDSIFELSKLLTTIMNLGLVKNISINEILNMHCICYLNQIHVDSRISDKEHIILAILTCLVTYYKNLEETANDNVTDNLFQCLPQICTFLYCSLLRNAAEQLLKHIICLSYCTPFVTWPQEEVGLMKEIQILSFCHYQLWPFKHTKLFFVVVYLQLKRLWSNLKILTAARLYLSDNALPHPVVLKALLRLYPIILDDNSVSNDTKKLLCALTTYKSLNGLLTYEPRQMEWLLKNASVSLQTRLITVWLTSKKDLQILEVLNETNTGYFLIEFLKNNPLTSQVTRISGLITQLTTYPKLQSTIASALPLFCNQPYIFSMLMKAKPIVASNEAEILMLIKIISACLHLLVDDEAVTVTCFYMVSLLRAAKNKVSALNSFCYFPVAVRYLVMTSSCKNDAACVSALSLLKELVKTQIQHSDFIANSTTINFVQILQGSFDRLMTGLKLLRLLLTHNNQSLLLHYPKEFYVNIYQVIHVILTEEVAQIGFDILKLLLIQEPKLAFLSTTPQYLRVMCPANINAQSIQTFVDFLKKWFEYVPKVLRTDISDNLTRILIPLSNQHKKYRILIKSLYAYSN